MIEEEEEKKISKKIDSKMNELYLKMVEDLEIDDNNVMKYMGKVLDAIKKVLEQNQKIQKVTYFIG